MHNQTSKRVHEISLLVLCLVVNNKQKIGNHIIQTSARPATSAFRLKNNPPDLDCLQ